MSDSPPPDSEDALRQLASQVQTPSDPVELDAIPTTPDHVDHDIGCLGCDYNLRGLPVGGSCPECGHSVHDSLRATLI